MRFLNKTSLMAVAFFAVTLCSALTARADIVIATGNNPQVDENVLLNTGVTGNPIFGITNQTGLSVRFASSETLVAPSNGQARVEAQDGTLTDLTIDMPGYTFTSLILNVDALANGSINFVVTEDNGQQTFGTFTLDDSGSNFFTITAINGQRIQSVAFSTNVAMIITDVDNVAQIRIGGAQPNVRTVPEPMTMILFGSGLAGVAGVARRRRRNLSS
jgi:hypothetical protein